MSKSDLSARRTKLVFVINSLVGGGAERVLTTLLAAAADERDAFDMTLILLDQETEAYRVPDWIKVIRLNHQGSFLRSLLDVPYVLRRQRPDVTLSFLARSNISTVLSGMFNRHRVVISERVNTSAHYGAGRRASVLKALIRLAYPQADLVIAPSAGVADDLIRNFRVPRDKLAVIANPVDVSSLRDRAAEPARLPVERPFNVAVGRLTPVKNFALLVDAYAQAPDLPPLIVLGRGPEEATLRARIARSGLESRIVLAGFQDNPFAIMQHAQAYVSASNGEGFPNGLVEAMALGLPVVFTNCASGPSEILADLPRDAVHGLTLAPHGILVPVNDAPALAEALRVIQDPANRERYSRAATARVADYGVRTAKDRYWNAIRSVVPALCRAHAR